jgi:DNA-binding PadR family transcriptional regulator
MPPVFSHGRLRLYLLKLLAEGPKHGYELIRLLENRFLGLYAPSAGTIYPRLQRLEAEGLVSHTAAGGRKVYEITDAGRAELRARAGEVAALEADIHASVADLTTLAAEISDEVQGSVRDMKAELRQASRQASPVRPKWGVSWNDWVKAGSAAPGPAQPPAPMPGGVSRPGGLAELESAAKTLFEEARRLAHQPGVGESELHAAAGVLHSALTEVRRLLRI